jgi:hypothetical protein
MSTKNNNENINDKDQNKNQSSRQNRQYSQNRKQSTNRNINYRNFRTQSRFNSQFYNRTSRINKNYFNKKFNNVIKVQNPKTINMNISREDKNMVITGKDIILTQDSNLNNNGLYAVIPINPAYWDNTRIKNIAVLNQYYIPINIKIEYVPLVSKFQKGNITIGTISNSTMSDQNIQSTLISSTSGITYSCSNAFVREIQIKSLIPQRKLLINSKLDKECVPFYICIYFKDIKDNGEDILPGQFYINYVFKFFNPVTNPSSFKSQQNVKLSQFDANFINITAMLTQENNNFKIGTIVDVELRENLYKYFINNSEVQLNTEKCATFMYSNAIENRIQPEPPVNYDLTEYNDSGISTQVTINNGYDILVQVDKTLNSITIISLVYGQSTATTMVRSSYYKLFKKNELQQDLPDPLLNIENSIMQLDTTTTYVSLQLQPINVNFITP